jgi:hypothetical protein
MGCPPTDHHERRWNFAQRVRAMGVALSPLVLSWAAWIKHFAEDADFEELFKIVTTGFSCAFDELPQKWYQVDNYVPEQHKPVVTKALQKEIDARRYMPVEPNSMPGIAALGVVDTDHSNFEKVRIVHDLSRPRGSSTNDRIDFVTKSFPTVKSAYAYMRPKWYMCKVDLTAAYRSVPLNSKLWRHVGLEWDGRAYRDVYMPFGIGRTGWLRHDHSGTSATVQVPRPTRHCGLY